MGKVDRYVVVHQDGARSEVSVLGGDARFDTFDVQISTVDDGFKIVSPIGTLSIDHATFEILDTFVKLLDLRLGPTKTIFSSDELSYLPNCT